jgi:hypothetical protein
VRGKICSTVKPRRAPAASRHCDARSHAGFWNMLAQATSSEDIQKRLDTLDHALADF